MTEDIQIISVEFFCCCCYLFRTVSSLTPFSKLFKLVVADFSDAVPEAPFRN